MEDDGYTPFMLLVLDGTRLVQVRGRGFTYVLCSRAYVCKRTSICFLSLFSSPYAYIHTYTCIVLPPPTRSSHSTTTLPATHQASNAACDRFFLTSIELAGGALKHRSLMALVFLS